jgi:rhodanese-related sulfurtransferase
MVFIDSHNEAQLSGYVLIDVSETREHATFPGHPSLNMPFSRFNLESPRLDRNHRYLLYCRKGTRSLHLTRELRRRGFSNVFALAGGVARFQPSKNITDETSKASSKSIAFINSSAG